MSQVNLLLPAFLLAAAMLAAYRRALRPRVLVAILVLVPASAGAWDQQATPAPPSAAADPTPTPNGPPPGMVNCPGWKQGDPPCYLTWAHYQDLLRRINAQQIASDNNRTFAPAPPPVDLTPVVEAQDRTTAAVENLDFSGSSTPWGWSWGLTASAFTVRHTGENEHPWVTRAGGFLRFVTDSHLGAEAGGGAGPWFYNGHNAVAVGGHGAFVASWDNIALLLGGDITHLENTHENRGGLLLGTAFLAPEVHGENILLRGLVGIATESEDPALSGLVLGLSVGGQFAIGD